MTFSYTPFDVHSRRHSIIEENGHTFTPLTSKPKKNTTMTHSRFFGQSKTDTREERITHLVKEPRLDSIKTNKKKYDAAIARIKKEYEQEQAVWNQIHPNKKAELIFTTEKELRLVLPYLPGTLLSEYDSEQPADALITCQKVLAIVDALTRLDKLGYCYGSFSCNNVLLEKNSDGSFQAYLIGLSNIHETKKFQSNAHWTLLNAFLYSVPTLQDREYSSFEKLTQDLLKEIKTLKQQDQQINTRTLVSP